MNPGATTSTLMGVREFAAEHPGMGLSTARREMLKLGGFKRGRRLYLARAVFDDANRKAAQTPIYRLDTNDRGQFERQRLAAAS